MKLNELSPKPGSKKKRLHVGRGIGSGKGKTAGRGVKGQKARTGVSGMVGFEGGQTPLYRRLPKLGFSNEAFRKNFVEINLGQLQNAIDAKKIDAKKLIDEDTLIASGILSRKRDGVKLLGNGELKAKVELKISRASKSAKEAVEKAGGKIELIVREIAPVKRPVRKKAE